MPEQGAVLVNYVTTALVLVSWVAQVVWSAVRPPRAGNRGLASADGRGVGRAWPLTVGLAFALVPLFILMLGMLQS